MWAGLHMAPFIGFAAGDGVYYTMVDEGLVALGSGLGLAYHIARQHTPQRQPCVPHLEETRRCSGLACPSQILPA